jgi:signal peptidase II
MLKQSKTIINWRKSGLSYVWLALVLVLIDQLTKIWAVSSLAPYEPVYIMSFFNFTLAFNHGAAFSFLGDAGGWQRWLFISLALGVSVVIFVWLAKTAKSQLVLTIGLLLILGGAIGNVIDRIMLDYVVDFLDFHWKAWHYPTFNIADIGITFGAVLLVWDAWKAKPIQENSMLTDK